MRPGHRSQRVEIVRDLSQSGKVAVGDHCLIRLPDRR
jgi:hypothetical protein